MKTLAILALGLLAVVSAKKYFYQIGSLTAADNSHGGQHIRSLNGLREYLGLSEHFSFQVEGSRKSASGAERVRLRQLFNGVPIRVATLQASQNEYGYYTGSVSGFCPSVPDDFDTSPTNSLSERMDALIDYMNTNDPEIPGRKLSVRELNNFNSEKQIHIDPETESPVVVYFVSALVERGLSNGGYIRYPRALMKAGSLEIISIQLPVQRGGSGHVCPDFKSCATACPKAKGGNAKQCGAAYGPGCNEVCLNASVRKNKCVLANERVNVKTVKNSWKREKARLVSFNCDEFLDDGEHGAYSPAADAYYFAQIFYDVLGLWGGVCLTHREPHTLYVHYGDSYANSFWDGQSTTFGDGGGQTYSYATAEAIGHEMAHALTDSYGNLVFDDESESLNEAFSDICGKSLTYYIYGKEAGWKFAESIMRDPSRALRYFENPSQDGVTIDSLNDYVPGMNRYVSVGIFLKAFHSIVEKQGVRFRDAYESFVFANQIYWNEETGFVDGACGVVKAARDLGLDTSAFENGFKDVDIHLSEPHCSLAGNADVIAYIGDSEIRHVTVSSIRKARYAVEPASGHSYIRVSVFGRGDNTVTIESQCASGSSSSSTDASDRFEINQGTNIVISSDSSDRIDLKVVFEYE